MIGDEGDDMTMATKTKTHQKKLLPVSLHGDCGWPAALVLFQLCNLCNDADCDFLAGTTLLLSSLLFNMLPDVSHWCMALHFAAWHRPRHCCATSCPQKVSS